MTVARASGNRLVTDLALAGLRVRPRWFYEVRHVSMLPPLVEAGFGVAAIPRLAMPSAEHPALASIPLVEPTVTRTLGLIQRRGRTLSPPAQRLYALIEEGRRSEPDDLPPAKVRNIAPAAASTPRLLRARNTPNQGGLRW